MFFMEVHLEVIHEKNLFNGHCGLILYKKIYKNTLKDSKQATPSDCNSSHGPKGDLKICILYSEILYTSLTSTVNLKGHGKEPENVPFIYRLRFKLY